MFRLVRNPDPRKKPPYGSRLDLYHPLSQGLVGCWLMNEGGGNTVYDLSGNRTNGTITGADWQGGGLYFNEVNGNDKVEMGFYDFSSWPELTVIAGIRWIETAQTDEYTIMSNWNALYASIIFRIEPAGNYLETYTIVEADTQVGGTFNDLTVDNNGKSSIIATKFDTDYLYAYVDGVKSSVSFTTGAVFDSDANTDKQLTIGTSPLTTGDTYNGYIDFVYLFHRALTDSEILQLYEEPYGHILVPQYWYMVDFGAAAGTTYYQNVSGTMGAITGSIAKAISVTRLGSMPAPSGSIAKQTSVSRYGNLPSPSGEVSTPGSYSQSLTGNLPAPTGSLTKTIAKSLAGIMGTITGSISRATSKLLSGAMPEPDGSLSHAFNTSQSVSGIMGAITGVLTTIKNPVSSAVKLLKIIGSSFKKLID